MGKKRNPDAGNNSVSARISDNELVELLELVKKSGKTKSQMARAAIAAGLPILRRKYAS